MRQNISHHYNLNNQDTKNAIRSDAVSSDYHLFAFFHSKIFGGNGHLLLPSLIVVSIHIYLIWICRSDFHLLQRCHSFRSKLCSSFLSAQATNSKSLPFRNSQTMGNTFDVGENIISKASLLLDATHFHPFMHMHLSKARNS